jgi:hypothetical protein
MNSLARLTTALDQKEQKWVRGSDGKYRSPESTDTIHEDGEKWARNHDDLDWHVDFYGSLEEAINQKHRTNAKR